METNNKLKVGIVGAGVSGLLACKHCMQKGLNPVVFEAESDIGGVWSKTLESTKLQTPKTYFQFSDFAWPESVEETFPDHRKVMEYLKSYATRFDLLTRINFNSKVISVDYSGPSHFDDSDCPFSTESTEKWSITVQHATLDASPTFQVYKMDFIILCIGNFSGLANTPEFPKNKGPEVFDGLVMHAMDFSAMDNDAASKLITGKRVIVVGSQKTALDLAAESANRNGAEIPCKLVFKRAHWMIPEYLAAFMFNGFNRFSEMMIHKPHHRFLHSLFITLFLSPLMWIFSKLVEMFLRTVYPLKKYDMLPSYGFVKHMFTCSTAVTPPYFFDRVKDGSLLPMKSSKFSFCKTGLVVEENTILTADIVIFATGYNPDEKLKSMFSSLYFKKCITSSSAPFYRECIHPRIPNMGIIGYADSPANIYTTEMKTRWLAHFLMGTFTLPSIREMEEDSVRWEKCKKRYGGGDYKRYCASPLLQIYANDQLCQDMGLNPNRKSWFLADLFEPYGPADYKF